MLHVNVLGTPYLLWDEESLIIARRIPRAILYYLAVEGEPVSRGSLQLLFWKNESDDASRARLRDNLTKLRASLPELNLIQTIHDTVMLAPDQVQVDLHIFHNLLDRAGQLPWQLSPEKPLPAAIYQDLAGAAKLWRGPGFLAGLKWPKSASPDDWQRTKEADIQHSLTRVLNRLIDHETILGNLEQVIDWILIALQLDDLDEYLHHVLLQTYLDLNRRLEAQKHYQEIENLYRTELKSDLPESIQLLQDQIFNMRSLAQDVNLLKWPVHSNIRTPFVGREDLLEQLKKFCSISSGVVIFGEAGAGKTRLVQECYQRRETKPRLLIGTGHSTESNLPYYTWINLLRNAIEPDEWQQLSPTWAAPLTIILPELKEIHQELQTQDLSNLDHPRAVLLEAIHQLLRVLANERPLILFVDDVHWVDESSLSILSYLLDQSFFDDGRNSLIMTARTEEINPWLDKLLLKTPSRKLRQIEVPSLDGGEVAHLVQYVLGQSPPQDFVDQLTKETGGNPLILLETLQDILQTSHAQDMQEIKNIPLAPSVHHMIQARMKTLSDLALEILSVGALTGGEFNLSFLQGIIKEEIVDVLEALEELEITRFVHSTQGDNQILYSFNHEKIRESILFDISPARKRLLHAKIAGTLEQHLGDHTEMRAAWIANHYQESGNLLKAFEFWIQAAQYAYSLFSIQEATDAFSNAERIIPREPGVSEEKLYQLYASWTDMAFENDNQETLFRINETLLSLGQDRNSDLLIGTAYDGLSDACFASNQFEKGLEFTLNAIPHLQRADNLYELLNAQMHQGVFLYMLGKFSEAQKILYDVLEKIPAERDEKFINLKSYLHFQIGTVEALTGYPVKGLEFLNRAIEPRGNNPVSSEAMLIYTAIGLANYIKGDFKAGYEACCKAIELGERLEYQRMLGYAYAYSALNAHNLGLLDKAWEHAYQALNIGQTYSHYEISALAYRTFGNTYMQLGDYQPAIEYFQKGVQTAGEHYVALELMTLLGYSMTAVGQVNEGLEYLTKAYETAAQLNMGSISVYAHSILLFTRHLHNVNNSCLPEEVEQVLADAKSRPVNKVVVILQVLSGRVSQRPDEFIKQMNESLQGASLLSDLLLEARLLRDLIIYKKDKDLPRKEEVQRLNAILEELAPRAVDMPYENAWNQYYKSMKST